MKFLCMQFFRIFFHYLPVIRIIIIIIIIIIKYLHIKFRFPMLDSALYIKLLSWLKRI